MKKYGVLYEAQGKLAMTKVTAERISITNGILVFLDSFDDTVAIFNSWVRIDRLL
jgi:hypothetical protein